MGDCKKSGVDPYLVQHVLAVDASVAGPAEALHVPDPAPFRDAFIGATEMAHGMTLVAGHVKDFVRFNGLDVIDPWHGQ